MISKLFILIFALFALFVFTPRAEAHPGRTASDGCHYCRTNCDSWGVAWNERHCHGSGSAPVQDQAPIQQESLVAPITAPQLYTPVPANTVYIPPTLTPTFTPIPTPTPTPYQETDLDKKKMFKVVKVIDGDTIEISIRGKTENVRLLAIDTPETVDPRKPVQCFGREASNKMKSFVDGKYIKLIDDRTQGNRDKYRRLLRYVYDGKIFINREMVAQGYAFSYKQYPTKYLNEFNKLEQQAREKNLGLWGKCI